MMKEHKFTLTDFAPQMLSTEVCKLELDPVNGLPRIIIENDVCYIRCDFIRAFPFDDPDHYISIINSEGDEVGMWTSLDGLDELSRNIVLDALDKRYFTPKIQIFYDIRKEADMWVLYTGTNRGDHVFHIRQWRDNAHELEPNRWLVLAEDGSRFEVPDIEELDERSQGLLTQLV